MDECSLIAQSFVSNKYLPRHPPLGHQGDILLLVLLRHALLLAVLLQLVVDDLAEHFKVHAEPQLQTALIDIVILYPDERVVELRVDRLDVLDGQLLVQHALVEGHGEPAVDEPAMVQGHRDEASDELEVLQVIGIHVRGGIYLQAVVVLVRVLKEAVHGIQDFVGEQEEPLARHTAVVQPLLAAKDDIKAPP